MRWTEPEHLRARRVRLDERQRAKAIVAYAEPNDYFPLAEILIRHTTAQMINVTHGDRLPMPQWCLVLLRERLLKAAAGPLPPDTQFGNCVVCAAAGDEHALADTGQLFACNVCLTPWHELCAQRWPYVGLREHDGAVVCPLCALP